MITEIRPRATDDSSNSTLSPPLGLVKLVDPGLGTACAGALSRLDRRKPASRMTSIGFIWMHHYWCGVRPASPAMAGTTSANPSTVTSGMVSGSEGFSFS